MLGVIHVTQYNDQTDFAKVCGRVYAFKFLKQFSGEVQPTGTVYYSLCSVPHSKPELGVVVPAFNPKRPR